MRRLAASLSTAVALVACHTSSSQSAPAPSTSPPAEPSRAPATSPSAPPAPASGTADAPAHAPPRVETACSEDRDCVVARIGVDGKYACCDACSVTPGNRRWYAALQLYCRSHAPSSCPPLACPMGPTRPRCQAGACIAEPSDGGFELESK